MRRCEGSDKFAVHSSTGSRRALDIKSARPLAHHDIRKLHAGFESIEAARAEQRHRLQLLASSQTDDGQIEARLRRCKKGARCQNAACRLCMRRLRIWWVGELMQVFQAEDALISVTLIPPKAPVAVGELSRFSQGRLFDSVRQQLTRAGCTSPVLGAIDGTFEYSESVWLPHVHLIAPANCRPAFESCRRLYPETGTGSAGMVIKKVNDRAGIISYCLKGYWQKRVPFTAASGRTRHKKCRLDPPQELEWLRWQAAQSPTALLFLYGVRRYGQSLRRHSNPKTGKLGAGSS